MSGSPAFAVTPRLAAVAISTANTNRDGTGTIADVIAGVAAGTRVSRVTIEASGTTTAGVVRLFLYDGSTHWLFDEILVPAVTPGTATAAFRASRRYDDLVLPSSSWKIRASTHNAEGFNVIAFGADL